MNLPDITAKHFKIVEDYLEFKEDKITISESCTQITLIAIIEELEYDLFIMDKVNISARKYLESKIKELKSQLT